MEPRCKDCNAENAVTKSRHCLKCASRYGAVITSAVPSPAPVYCGLCGSAKHNREQCEPDDVIRALRWHTASENLYKKDVDVLIDHVAELTARIGWYADQLANEIERHFALGLVAEEGARELLNVDAHPRDRTEAAEKIMRALGFEWPAEFDAECLRVYGRVLTGAKKHWCDDWDGLPIDETTKEFQCCGCTFDDEPAEV